ncbi:MAG TPA: aminotransferase class III-fold pyridoxal phosphate-dependent enzyme, partial [Gemmatimonadaceae bacterium]|nr:aminotransferase class III-fold pyridoxal phosphate-dependent enzyme [Gemmatimonadaceae bacterium]
MPGGVSSPVRAFGGVGGEPFVVARGEGARIWDEDGKEYIDFVLSWGPLVLGHAAPAVLDALDDAMRRGTSFGITTALEDTMRRGTSFGIPTELEVRLAELITERMPHIEMLRFVSSGTEATM